VWCCFLFSNPLTLIVGVSVVLQSFPVRVQEFLRRDGYSTVSRDPEDEEDGAGVELTGLHAEKERPGYDLEPLMHNSDGDSSFDEAFSRLQVVNSSKRAVRPAKDVVINSTPTDFKAGSITRRSTHGTSSRVDDTSPTSLAHIVPVPSSSSVHGPSSSGSSTSKTEDVSFESHAYRGRDSGRLRRSPDTSDSSPTSGDVPDDKRLRL
jgi:hypothetical protein